MQKRALCDSTKRGVLGASVRAALCPARALQVQVSHSKVAENQPFKRTLIGLVWVRLRAKVSNGIDF
eukprot:1452692-Amphidinium_carterae.1